MGKSKFDTGYLALLPFALLNIFVVICMFTPFGQSEFLMFDIYTSGLLAKALSFVPAIVFWKIVADLINVKYEPSHGTQLALLACSALQVMLAGGYLF